MPIFRDDERGTVRVEVNGEMWTAIHAPGQDPGREIQRRGLDVLRLRYNCEEDEVQAIEKDPVYENSCNAEYWRARRLYTEKRKLPSHLKLEFQRPGTRKPNMKPEKEE